MLNKEFTYKGISITRGDYESMPCPMYAHDKICADYELRIMNLEKQLSHEIAEHYTWD